jgi:hypothetical protein
MFVNITSGVSAVATGNVIDSVNNSTMRNPLIARITIEEPDLVDNQVWLTSSGH